MKLFAVLIGFFLPIIITSEKDIEIYTYWHAGNTQNLIIKEGFIEYVDDEVVKKEVTISKVIVTVLEETDSSYIVEWHYTGDEIERLNVEVEEEEPIDKKIEEIFSSVKLVFQTDEFGVFQQTLNMDEVMNSFSAGLTTFVNEEMEDVDPSFLNLMKEMYSSEAMKDELERDIWNYHYYLGDVMASDTSVIYEDEIDNQITGGKIPLNGIVSIITNEEDKTIQINDIKKMERASLNDAIGNVEKNLNLPSDREFNEAVENNEFDITDIENYTYDYDYGWLRYYERNRITSTKNNRKEKFIIMRAID